MKEQLIEFNTAKLAKEKGFDLKSNHFYDTDGTLLFTTFSLGRGIEGGTEVIEVEEIKNFNSFEDRVSAPTQSLLAKWLREVHNIHVDVMSHNINDFWYNLQQFNNESRLIYKTNLSNFNTYEKAYEHGLFEALKLIKTD